MVHEYAYKTYEYISKRANSIHKQSRLQVDLFLFHHASYQWTLG